MSTASGPTQAELSMLAREVLEEHWRPAGFTCPNSEVYPWLWLWDSSFHAILWAELGEGGRALEELESVLAGQDETGFVPHVRYLDGSDRHAGFWGRPKTSSITQPPIYALAVTGLTKNGVTVPDRVVQQAIDGLLFLFERRRRSPAGLIEIVHPWESGCDHSPRWDDLMKSVPADGPTASGPDPFDADQWFKRKGALLGDVVRSTGGAPLSNPSFPVGSVAFSAIVAFCAAELGAAANSTRLTDHAAEVSAALNERWEPGLRTWIDDGPTSKHSGRIRTLEALLPLLVEDRAEVVAAVSAELDDPGSFRGEFGLRQVNLQEPTYARGSYWRGPCWPQLDYLMWLAVCRAGLGDDADRIAVAARRGAMASGFSEYWDADTGAPGGAQPQSWSTLPICMHSRVPNLE